MDKIEATYTNLQEQSSGSNDTKLGDKTSPDCCLNQDLVNLAERIKLRKGGKPDYEMVLTLFPFCIHNIKIKGS